MVTKKVQAETEEKEKPAETRYPILNNIRYRGPGEYYMQVIKPADHKEVLYLNFDYLAESEIRLLRKKGFLGEPKLF